MASCRTRPALVVYAYDVHSASVVSCTTTGTMRFRRAGRTRSITAVWQRQAFPWRFTVVLQAYGKHIRSHRRAEILSSTDPHHSRLPLVPNHRPAEEI